MNAPVSPPVALSQDWDALDQGKFADETVTVHGLLANMPLDGTGRAAVLGEAIGLVERARASVKKQGVVESFLQEFSLGTREGLALMCLAEALLRTPDADTRDRLIAEKLVAGDWGAHAGRSSSLFVNASTWGLMLTGRLVDLPGELQRGDTGGWLRGLTQRASEPIVRQALRRAMKSHSSASTPASSGGASYSASRSSTFRNDSGNRTYISTARRMISGDELK